MTSNSNKSVNVLSGNGDGTFQAAVSFAVGNYPFSLAIADFNYDGRSDMAVANELDNTVGVLLNATSDNLPPELTARNSRVQIDEGQQAVNDGTWSDASQDRAGVTLTASVGTVDKHDDGTWTWSYSPIDDAGQPASVTITADDGKPDGVSSVTFSFAVNDVPPTVTIIGAPSSSPEGTAIRLTSTVTDPSPADIDLGLTYAWSVTKDGQPYDPRTPTDQPTFDLMPNDNATYVVDLTVTEGDRTASARWRLQEPFDPATQSRVLVTGTGVHGGECRPQSTETFQGKLFYTVRDAGGLEPTKVFGFDPGTQEQFEVLAVPSTGLSYDQFIALRTMKGALYISASKRRYLAVRRRRRHESGHSPV